MIRRSLTAAILLVFVFAVAACTVPPVATPGVAAQPAPSAPVGEQGEADVRVIVTEGFVNRMLVEQMDALLPTETGFTLQDPVLDLLPAGRMGIAASVTFPILDRDLTLRPVVTLTVTVADEQLQVGVEGISVSGIVIPTQLISAQLDEAEAMLGQQVEATLQQLTDATNLRLVGISTTSDTLTLDLSE